MTCYYCKTTIGPENSSLEHILPKTLGGKLTSSDLLCKKCNSLLGHKIDSLLSKKLRPFYSLLSMENSNGDYVSSKFSLTDGEMIEADPSLGVVPANPKGEIKVSKNKFDISISAKNKKQAMQYAKKYLRKLPPGAVVQRVSIGRTADHLYLQQKRYNSEIPKGSLMPAVSKIALSYYLYTNGHSEKIGHLVNNIDGVGTFTGIFYFYPDSISRKSDEFFNVIHLVGDPNENLEYVYVEIFGTFRYLVAIDPNYSGSYYKSTYAVDPLKNEQLSLDWGSLLTSDDYDRLPEMMGEYEGRLEGRYREAQSVAWSRFNRLVRGEELDKPTHSI